MPRCFFTATLVLLASPLPAGVVKGVDLRDAFGGLLGIAAVAFFMYQCFKGDRHPPYPGFLTNKRDERKLTGEIAQQPAQQTDIQAE